MTQADPVKILVIRGGAIGDFILTLPVLAALRRQFPSCQLELMGYAHIASLAQAGGLVHAVRSIDARPLAGFFASGGVLAEDLADYFSEFALILSYLYDPDEVFEINVRRCSPAQYISGPHRPDENQGLHATSCLLKPLERLAIFNPNPVPHLPLRKPQRRSPPLLALHPGSGSERKNWPEPLWRDFLRQLPGQWSGCFLLVGGEAEGDRLDRLSRLLPPERMERAHHVPLDQLSHRLAQCAAFVGHDSGISHLAAAVGLPSLVLWGDTKEEVWRPLGEHVRILRHSAGLSSLSPEQVLMSLHSFLAEETTGSS